MTAGPDGNLREDALLDGRVRLRQRADGYRVAIDPVLLAAAVPARAGERVLDLGCGGGAAALCLLVRVAGVRAVGLELQEDLARLAGANAALNGATDRFRAVRGDVLQPPFRADSLDHVFCNPPYLPAARARPGPADSRRIANVEGAAKLVDWVAAALALVKPRGTVTFVHRADRLDDLLWALNERAGGIVVVPLWPREGRDAKRVLVQARRGVATPLRLAAGLVLHDAAGGFTAEADAVLRRGEGLELSASA